MRSKFSVFSFQFSVLAAVLCLAGCEVLTPDTSRFEAMGAAAADLAYAALNDMPTPQPVPNGPDRGESRAVRGDQPLAGPPTDRGEALVEGSFHGSEGPGAGVPILVPAGERPPLSGTVDYAVASKKTAEPESDPVSQTETVRICGPQGCVIEQWSELGVPTSSEERVQTLGERVQWSEGYVKRGLFGRPKFKRSRGGRSCGPGGCG